MTGWCDLGELGPQVLVFGGACSNLQATQALLAKAADLDVPAAAVICTGDLVAYCGDPAATVTAIRAAGGPVIAGNCEIQIAEEQTDCGCGFEDRSACDLASNAWFAHARAAIDAETRDWMAQLPRGASFTLEGRRYAVLHGGATRVNRFLWPTSPDAEFADEIAAVTAAVGPVDGILAGHCGLAFHRDIGGTDWINAGAIGMPPHDGRAETRFVLLTARGPVIHRLSYDAAAAQAAMQAAGLTQGYDRTLLSGLWPDQGMLPAELQH